MNTQETRLLGRQYLYELYSQTDGYDQLSTQVKEYNEKMTAITDLGKHLPHYSFKDHAFFNPHNYNLASQDRYKVSNDYFTHRLSSMVIKLFSVEKRKAVESYLFAKCVKGTKLFGTASFIEEGGELENNAARARIDKLLGKIEKKQFKSNDEKAEKIAKHQAYLASDQFKIDQLKEESGFLEGTISFQATQLKQQFLMILPGLKADDLKDLIQNIEQKPAYSDSAKELKPKLIATLKNLLAAVMDPCNFENALDQLNLFSIADERNFNFMNEDAITALKKLKNVVEQYIKIYENLQKNKAQFAELKAQLEQLSPKEIISGSTATDSPDSTLPVASPSTLSPQDSSQNTHMTSGDSQSSGVNISVSSTDTGSSEPTPSPVVQNTPTATAFAVDVPVKPAGVENIQNSHTTSAESQLSGLNVPVSSTNPESSALTPPAVAQGTPIATLPAVDVPVKPENEEIDLLKNLETVAEPVVEKKSSFFGRLFSPITAGLSYLRNWIVGLWNYFFG